ncbi:5-hydroxytryptamine receptor 1A isoform X1 [Melanaphis sacchari]|uniref:Beta-1 adrenergic receptor n=2 Tax=Melanaphis sacchari TaxID=742174 RepID=A0A2H8TMI1_9HEMI|nr:5-hydroxytryptamine receptor 1A isoform X1 [Melanaphis sacchari]XP_025206002.1 5-hydroxytryptamine receptor 1A isoform X1 [Melanaphis sacchari]
MALMLVGLLKVFSALVLIVSTSSNSLLLLVFYRRPGLRTLSNRFVMNLLVTNLASSWILVPLTLWESGPFSSWTSPLPPAVWHGLTGAVYAQSVLSVMTVAVDQYYAVTDPLRYHVTVNAASCAVAVAVTWCLSAVAGALSALCELSVAPEVYRLVFPVTYAVLLYVVPFVTVCVVYVKICTAAHRNSERARRNGSVPDHLQQQQPLQQQQQQQPQQQQQQPLQQQLQYNNNNNNNANINNNINNNEYNIVPTIQEEDDEALESASLQAAVSYEPEASSKPPQSTRASLKSTSSSIVNHLRYRISNASMFRYREETRAAKISALVIVTAAACWTPYAVLKLSEWPPLFGSGIPSPGPLAALLSLSAHAVITPILFAHRNRRVHRELCRIFCRRKRCSSFYDNVRNATVASSVASGPIKSAATIGGGGGLKAAGPQHVFGRWFGGGQGGGIGFDKSAAKPYVAPSSVVVPAAAHLPTDTEMTRSSFSSNGSATTQTSSVITVD